MTGQSRFKDGSLHLLENMEVLKSTHTLCFVQINFLIFFFPHICSALSPLAVERGMFMWQKVLEGALFIRSSC